MLIAHISDTHVMPPGQLTHGIAPMAENLVRCVADINALDPRPDLVLLSGDVTDKATRAEAEHAAKILSALAMPLFIVPGNHDDRRVLCEIFGPDICPPNSDGFVDYVIDGYPVRIIALDSLDAGLVSGRITDDRLNWLKKRLAEETHQPTLIVAHHPPLKLGVPETDDYDFAGATALGKIIASHSNIERFLCGHIHLHINARWCGTIVTTAPSMGTQLTLDLNQRAPSQFLLSDPAYLLHHWTKDSQLVTHPIQVTKLQGPFEFD